MGPELLSTVRPTRLRLAGFLALTVGGALVAWGSLLTWATIRPFATGIRGVDTWEGRVTLALGIALLLGMIVMRLLRTPRGRIAAAVVLLVLGLAAAALATMDVVRADERFTDPGARDRIARALAEQHGLPYGQVRAVIEQQFDRRFSVELGSGIWLVAGGGLLAAGGGALSIAWGRSRRPSSGAEPGDGDREDRESDPATGADELG